MGRYTVMRKCKRSNSEVAEVTFPAPVRMTRARTAAAAAAAAAESIAHKSTETKRKLDGDGEVDESGLKLCRIVDSISPRTSANSHNSADHDCILGPSCSDSDENDNHVISSTSCCSSNASPQLESKNFNSVDLKDEEETVEIDVETSNTNECGIGVGHCRITSTTIATGERSESTPPPPPVCKSKQFSGGELAADSPTSMLPSDAVPQPSTTAVTMPSQDELDEFFAAAEKDFQKKIAKKYNFDFVKEEPLKGRYEWVRVQP